MDNERTLATSVHECRMGAGTPGHGARVRFLFNPRRPVRQSAWRACRADSRFPGPGGTPDERTPGPVSMWQNGAARASMVAIVTPRAPSLCLRWAGTGSVFAKFPRKSLDTAGCPRQARVGIPLVIDGDIYRTLAASVHGCRMGAGALGHRGKRPDSCLRPFVRPQDFSHAISAHSIGVLPMRRPSRA